MTDDIPDINDISNLNAGPPWRWLRLQPACEYAGISPQRMRAKVAAGIGPPFVRMPGSRILLIRSDRLDEWIEGSPETPQTPREVERIARFKQAVAREFERRRAAKAARRAVSLKAIGKPHDEAPRTRAQRRAKRVDEDLNA